MRVNYGTTVHRIRQRFHNFVQQVLTKILLRVAIKASLVYGAVFVKQIYILHTYLLANSREKIYILTEKIKSDL